MEIKKLKEQIAVSRKQERADLVIRGGKVINVFSGEIRKADIAIKDGTIVGVGEFDHADEIIDAKGKYIAPGFIDAHVHVESAMIPPAELARVLLPNGVTTIVTDPHEIANVAGKSGIEFMLKDAEKSLLDMFVMLPSSVPATSKELAGAHLCAQELKELYSHKKVIGLAEVMDFSSLVKGDPDTLQKIIDAKLAGGLIDGHAAGLNQMDLNSYLTAGIRTDHESTTKEEALDRVRAGMFVMLREGTVARDVEQTVKAVTAHNSHRFCFCTDDKLIPDLVHEGSINYNVKLAIQSGIDPITAIQMATINAAHCHQLSSLGAVAAGYQADLLILSDLEKVHIEKVIKHGEIVVNSGKRNEEAFVKKEKIKFHSPKINHHFTRKDLHLPLKKSKVQVIGLVPNNVFTKQLFMDVKIEEGLFIPEPERDLAKLVVVERHKGTGCVGVGIVKGFGLRKGAIATTVAHDSHNIVAVGIDDVDIEIAICHLTKIGGGIVMVSDGKVLHDLPLQIAGLLSDQSYEKVQSDLTNLKDGFCSISTATNFDPFLTLSFLTLPVIPELKLTARGLFDFRKFDIVPPEAD